MKSNSIKPKRSPWGRPQTMNQIAPGITKYSTASHGGFYLSAELNSHIPQILKQATFGGLGEKGWYEEDIDWSIVVYAYPDYFSATEVQTALDCLKQFHAEAWKHLQNSKS